MNIRIGVVFVIIIFMATGLLSIQTIPCSADVVTNSFYYADGTLQNGTFLSMPEAYVKINIVKKSGIYLNMSCQFIIQTNITQNSTLAFVFPDDWSNNENILLDSIMIKVNESQVDYIIQSWEELGWNLTEYSLDNYSNWYADASYAVFEESFQANTTKIVEVRLTGKLVAIGEGVTLSYIIGSARTFIGDTHQTISVCVFEESLFMGKDFHPDENLMIQYDGIMTNATWNFYINEFEYDSISVYLKVTEHEPHTIPIPTTTLTTTTTTTTNTTFSSLVISGTAIGAVVGFIVLVAMFLKKKGNN